MKNSRKLHEIPQEAAAWPAAAGVGLVSPTTIYQSDMSPHPAYTYIQLYISQNVYISHQIYVYVNCRTDIYHDMPPNPAPLPNCMPPTTTTSVV